MELEKSIADLHALVIQHGWGGDEGHGTALACVERELAAKAEGDVLLAQARAIIIQQQAEIKVLRLQAAEIEYLEEREDDLINRACRLAEVVEESKRE